MLRKRFRNVAFFLPNNKNVLLILMDYEDWFEGGCCCGGGEPAEVSVAVALLFARPVVRFIVFVSLVSDCLSHSHPQPTHHSLLIPRRGER